MNGPAAARPAPFSSWQRYKSNFFWLAEHLLGTTRFAERFGEAAKAHTDRLLRRLENRGDGRVVEVRRAENIDPAAFRRYFHGPGVPVVLAGAAKDWECCRRWTPDFFAENYGAEMGSITDYGEDKPLPLAEIVARIRKRDLRASHFSRVVHNHKELTAQLNIAYIEAFYPLLTHKTTFQFFIGPPGVQTKIHAGATNNFHVQVHGEKTWWIVDPNFNPVIRPKITGSPLLAASLDPLARNGAPTDRYIDIYKAKLYPGDILYIPAFYWHHVSYDTESIATGFRWVTPADVLRGAMMFNIMLTATNPSFLEYYVKFMTGKLIPFFGSKRGKAPAGV